jgi:formate hydrogenlyase transcriptional activator
MMLAGAVRVKEFPVQHVAHFEEPPMAGASDAILGCSAALCQVLGHVRKVAAVDATVLITGETGTGKEMIAQAIHEKSRRAGRPFLKVNCAAITPSLITSELFGYERGAFTGAVQRHVGRFEAANGGTIFLDEIGDVPPETQIALLRVLQEREIERIGGTRAVPVDVRVLAATNRDLDSAVEKGAFRLDLFYRLNVFRIHMPPLRERPGDVLLLATYFMKRFAASMAKTIISIEYPTIKRLQSYDWPGNIRELQNLVERAVILCEGGTLSIDEAWLRPRRISKTDTLVEVLSSQEREIIEAALEESRGRVAGPSGAADRLGMRRTTLESKIRALRIDKYRFKSASSVGRKPLCSTRSIGD